MSYLLTPEEKHRFSQWLTLQIDSSKGMLEQFKNLAPALGDALIKREKTKLAGYMIVLQDIQEGESMTIGGSNEIP